MGAGNGFFGSSGCRPLTDIIAFIIIIIIFYTYRKILTCRVNPVFVYKLYNKILRYNGKEWRKGKRGTYIYSALP